MDYSALPCGKRVWEMNMSQQAVGCTSGCVKQAAGTELWLRTCGRLQMFSTALIPCALAAWASMYLPAHWEDIVL